MKLSILSIIMLILAWGSLLVLTPDMWRITLALALVSIVFALISAIRNPKSSVGWITCTLVCLLDVVAAVAAM